MTKVDDLGVTTKSHQLLTRYSFALVLLCLLTDRAIAQPLPAAGQPNIVIILTDDLGYGDLRSYNPDSRIPTTHLDRLAAQGTRFTDAHSPSSVCTPTRYGLLTGRYAWRTRLKNGVLNGYSPLLIEPGRLTLASLVKQRGYATAALGKWHLGLGTAEPADFSQRLEPGPNSVGFDDFFGIPASLDMPPYVFVENTAVTAAPTATIAASEMRRKGGDGFWRAGAIAPGFTHERVLPALTDKAVSFIGKQSPGTTQSVVAETGDRGEADDIAEEIPDGGAQPLIGRDRDAETNREITTAGRPAPGVVRDGAPVESGDPGSSPCRTPQRACSSLMTCERIRWARSAIRR